MKFNPPRKLFFSGLTAIALAIAALAQQPSSNSPSPERIRNTVTYLASDALDGRRTGTPGATDAARYIAAEFQRLGLKPPVPPAGRARRQGDLSQYEQKFPYISSVTLGSKNLLYVKPKRAEDAAQFHVEKDWMPLGFSANGEFDCEFVFAGYGLSSAELNYDDYANTPIKGRIGVVFDGSPDGDNPHGQFARAAGIRFKVAAAQAAGARGLVIITAEKSFKDDRLTRLTYDNSGESQIAVIVVSRDLASRLLGTMDKSLADFEKVADARKSSTAGQGSNNLRTPSTGISISLSTDVARREGPAANVIGIIEGSEPQLKNEAIVFGAHYDHLGHGGEGSLAPREGEIHHGADDNASGVAGLLELARLFSTYKPRRTMMFMAFSGEEEGLLGSNYYVNHPILPLTNVAAMLNMDMIGRMKENKLIVGGMGTAPEWQAIVTSANSTEKFKVSAAGIGSTEISGLPVTLPVVIGANGNPIVGVEHNQPFDLTLNQDGFGPSDHSSFYSKQVPVLFFWTGTHNDYHKPSDTSDKINYEDEIRVVAFVQRIAQDLDKSDKRPTYAVAKSDSQGRATGFRVYLGTIPNYADAKDGLLLDGVRDDSPAAKAGLKAGDKIVKLAGRDVKNVYDYTYALGEMKAGQEYEVELLRGTERLKLKITPEARK